ncbi:MAG TPA: DUF1800 family protein [Cyclobacteriaceae bacterium]|nr:DUF1800 domain-containing protein [Cyclobacteriaceae bacterium]HMV08887.1 DUF1800 family protein [Cyclobacteriaceae bacterium]HMV89312.1 DUF1800 family protein [Cyclobacteriaceae bacterium]HMX00358.1 DUF1800 family protein [Cyclobacteriaceae bacterium]HMX49643.1 DUF1800 family protein [Cyclobacteriaceae bacterium]
MPLTPQTGTLGRRGAAHLLRRATYGPTIQQIKAFSGLTAAQAIQQLYHQAIPDAAPPVDPDTNEPWVITGVTDPEKMEFQYQEYFKRWFIGQMMSAGIPAGQSLAYSAREKIVFFIHTVLTAIAEKIGSSRAMYYQNQLFRLYALDGVTSPVVPPAKLNFKELTKKVSVDNAMLNLLDGTINIRGGNENYGRELLELYSIGRGLESSDVTAGLGQGDYFYYTEQDVQAAAKVFSGFQFDDQFAVIDPDTLLPRGKVRGSVTNASAHDNSSKQFSLRFGDAAIAPDPLLLNGTNATEESALDEISRFIDLIYQQDETANYICRKIYRFFMYHEITDTINTNIIQQMAATFRANNFKIQPVIEELLSSQHFYNNNTTPYADDGFGGIIKSPLDLMIGTYRFFGIQVPSLATDAAGFYNRTGMVIDRVKMMGMDFYQPFDVAGYDAYHQYPIYHRSWITVNNLTNRYNFIYEFLPDIELYQFIRDNIDFAEASDARRLIIDLASFVLPQVNNLTFDTSMDESQQATVTSERLLYFLNKFLDIIDPDPEAAWTDRYTNQQGIATMEGQLHNLFNAMLQSPEYQLQ